MTDNLGKSLLVNNIILIGFMAAGKSTVGKMLAQELNWNFIDTDQVIEEVTGFKVNELFRRYGEVRFRSEEKLIVSRVSRESHTVISTGGGTIFDLENWLMLKEIGLVIHLFVPLDVALARVKKRQDRPMLMKNSQEIETLWHERLPRYHEANITIDTSNKDIPTIITEVLALLKGGYIRK